MNKKFYNCPSTEVMQVVSSYGVCQLISYTEDLSAPIDADPGDGI